MSTEAMKLALRSLKELVPDDSDYAPALQGQRKRQEKAITAIKEALAAPEQEPDAYLHDDGYWTAAKTYAGRQLNDRLLFAGSAKIGVYTNPPAAPVQDVDWKDMYEKEKRRSEMWIAKYEKDIGPLEKAVPVAAPVQENL